MNKEQLIEKCKDREFYCKDMEEWGQCVAMVKSLGIPEFSNNSFDFYPKVSAFRVGKSFLRTTKCCDSESALEFLSYIDDPEYENHEIISNGVKIIVELPTWLHDEPPKKLNKREKLDGRLNQVKELTDREFECVFEGNTIGDYHKGKYRPYGKLCPEEMVYFSNWVLDLEKL
jgi:hypothetical protein